MTRILPRVGHLAHQAAAHGFSARSLYLTGAQGVWFDLQGTPALYQDAAGTTPAGNGDPVGLVLDQHGWGGRTLAQMLAAYATSDPTALPGNHAAQATASCKPIWRDAGGAPYLEFDGVDDYLVTGSIDFSAGDEMSVFAAARKGSDAAKAILIELSATTGSNNGSFNLTAPGDELNDYEWQSKGTAQASPDTGIFTAPHTAILTALSDISGDSAILRVNGAQAATSSADQGTGNFGNHPLYIGRRGGTSLPFSGYLYDLAIVAKLASAGEIASVETAFNRTVGAY